MENSEEILERLSSLEVIQSDIDDQIVADQTITEQCKVKCDEISGEAKSDEKESCLKSNVDHMLQKQSIYSTDSPNFVQGDHIEEQDSGNSGKN